ncbi:MAG: aldo/keto reductase [Bacteroidaceae bacterium]|nr:aldo/keto reductase [Bacteroidaceae bacterium]
MAENKKGIDNILNKECDRRTALKIMAAGGAGVLFSGSLLESCKGSTAKATPAPKMAAGANDKIASAHWNTTGDTVGLLGLGCMRLPQQGGQQGGFGGGFGRGGAIDQEQVNAMVDYALAHGINYFDTAPAYNGSEAAMGIALARHPRESYLLATKMSNFNGGTADAAKQMFNTSLERLQTTYIDYFLLHGASSKRDMDNRFVNNGVMDFIQGEKKAGRIKHIGFSFHGSRSDMDYMLSLHSKYHWDFIQIQMNYVDWEAASARNADARYLYESIYKLGIPIVVMEPIRGGALANVHDKFREMMAEAHPELSPAGMALSFVASYPGIMTVLSGMSNMEQMTENVATFTNFKALSQQDRDLLLKIARMQRENSTIGCTACRYCMPCGYGVDIPGNFQIYDKSANDYCLPNPDGEHDKDYAKNRRAFLNKYNSLDASARADKCASCRACVSKCPQHIDIPTQLNKIRDLVSVLEKG